MTDGLPAGIDPSVPPSGAGCVECDASGGWWVHLRRCAQCGHVGCCDSSPSQHASKHAASTKHPFMQSYEPVRIGSGASKPTRRTTDLNWRRPLHIP